MEKKFEIIVRDTQTKEEQVAVTCDDNWTDLDDKPFTATIEIVVRKIQELDEAGQLF